MAKHLHELRGITFQEYGALMGTRAMLVAGTVTFGHGQTDATEGHLFNMNRTCSVKGCGTVGCIGGTMALIMGLSQDAADHYVMAHKEDYPDETGIASASLRRLFHPEYCPKEWEDITPEEGVRAIDNWLRTGDPDWSSAVNS